MACCLRSVSWECCYPDSCSCCSGCISCACCNSNNCSGDCGGTICGQGGCCTCNSNSWGYAWKSSSCAGCSFCASCGTNFGFNVAGASCGIWYQAPRVDTHNENAATAADLTKSLFTQFAPLSQGIIQNMRISNDDSCFGCDI